MRKNWKYVKRAFSILLALALIISGSQLSGILGAKNASFPKVAIAADDESTVPEGYIEYPLYNFVQILGAGDRGYGRLQKTTIYTTDTLQNMLTQHGSPYTLKADEFITEPFSFKNVILHLQGTDSNNAQLNSYNGTYVWLDDVLSGRITYTDTYTGCYIVSKNKDIQAFKNKIGGTGYSFVTDETFSEPNNIDCFHRDYPVTIVFGGPAPQKLYSFLSVTGNGVSGHNKNDYYRLSKTDDTILSYPVEEMSDDYEIDESYEYFDSIVSGHYDFTNVSLTFDEVTYTYQDANYVPTGSDFDPYYQVEFDAIRVINKVHKADPEWFDNPAGWLDGNGQGWTEVTSNDTRLFHRDYKATLHAPGCNALIRFYDENGTVLQSGNQPEGSQTKFNKTLPVKEADENYYYVVYWKDTKGNEYRFDQLPMVVGAEDYTAVFHPYPKNITVTIKGHTDEVTYDGDNHSVSGYDVEISSDLYTTDDFTFSGTSVVNGIDSGSYTSELDASQFTNENTTLFPSVQFVIDNQVELTVNPAPVTITAKSEAFVYDGASHSNSGYDVVGLVGSDAITAVVSGSISYPSESPVTNVVNSYTFTVGNPDNYEVTTVNGQLTMTNASIAITITAASDAWTYDGSAHSNNTVTVTSGELLEGDELVAQATGNVTNVSESEAGNNPIAAGYKIMHGDEDVTDNYAITAVAGTLTVNPKEVTVTAEDKAFTYNGTAQSWPEYDVDGLVGEDAISAVVTGSITFPSESPVANVVSSYNFTAGTAGNYTVTTANGQLTMTNASIAITITAADGEWTYDGSAHSNTAVTVTSGSLLDGDELVATATGSVTNVADTAAGNNPIAEGYKIMHDDEDVTANYAITVENGTLTINKRNVTLNSESQVRTYDGTTLTASTVTVEGDGFVEGEVSDIKAIGSVTTVAQGLVTNTITYTAGESFKEENYTITKNEGTLRIAQVTAVLEITSSTKSWTYDGQLHKDEVYTVTFDGNTFEASPDGTVYTVTLPTGDNVTITPTSGGIIEYSSEGVKNYFTYQLENADCYANVTINLGTLTINPKAVTITAQDKAFVYNGTAQSWPEYDVDGLVGDDKIKATVTGSITFPSESPVPNVVESYEFTAGNPNNYTVTTANGELTMTNASVAITITSASGEWTYDGTAHSNNTVTVTEGSLLDGDELVATATGSVTNVADTVTGNNPVASGYKIMHGDQDVTENYAITTVAGTLTINPKAVTITAQDKAFTYNGTAQSWDKYDVAGLVGSDAIDATVTGSITFPSDSPVANVVSSYNFITGTAGNYAVTTVNGQLTMTSASVAITITSGNGEWTYDGTAHSNTEVTITSGELLAGDRLVAEAIGIVTNVADSEIGNNFIYEDYKIMHGDVDVSDNYTITTVAGTLTINPKAVTVTAQDKEFTYNGTAQSWAEYDVDGLVGDDEISAVVTGSITFPSERPVTNELTSYEFTAGTPGNYTVTTADGELTMTNASAAITITAASNEWTYDGTAHKNTAVTVTEGSLLEGDELVATATGSVTNVADTATGNNPIAEGYKIMHGDMDVTGNYTITPVAGTLTINKRSVTLTSESDSREYNGTALTNPNVTVSGDGFVEGEVTNIITTGSVTFVSSVTNTITFTEGANYKADNYNITKNEGTLTVTKNTKLLVVASETKSWVYDGQTHKCEEYTVTFGDETCEVVNGEATLSTGDKITVTPTASGVKDYTTGEPNSFTWIVENEDCYTKGTGVVGTLSIDKRPLTITANDASDEYNGSDITYKSAADAVEPYYTISEGTLADGQSITAITISGSGKKVGNYTITISEGSVEIGDYTSNYDITLETGTLTIKQNSAEIKVVPGSDSKKYDGTPLTKNDHDDFEVTGVPEGFTWTAVANGTVTNVVPGADENATNAVTEFKIFDGEGNDVTDQFANIDTSATGTLTITKRSVTLTSADDEKEYDGTALSNSEITVSEDNFAEGEGYVAAVTGSVINVGTAENTFTYVLNENTLAGNYEITIVFGTLEVTPLEAVLEWTDTRFPYDKENHVPVATVSNLVEGDECEVTVTGEKKDIGENYVATATELSNPNYKLPEENTTTFSIYSCVVIFKNEDGTELKRVGAAFGTKPVYDGETPTKESTAKYSYEFDGWTPEIVEVEADETVYTAKYKEVLRSYTIEPSDLPEGVKLSVGEKKTVDAGADLTFTVSLEKGYDKTDSFVVKANGTTVTPDADGYYKISGILENVKITVSGVEKVSYSVVDGDKTKHVIGENTIAKFVFKRNLNDAETFGRNTAVLLDGKALEAGQFTKSSGSLIVELKADFLNTLSVGEHVLTVRFDDYDGDVNARLIIEKAADPAPQTGDTGNLTLWIVIGVVSLVAFLALFLLICKRRRDEEEEEI